MPDPDLEIRGNGYPDPKVKEGGVSQIIFFGSLGLNLI